MRVYFTVQSEYFNDTHSYFMIREIEHIESTGKPIIHDDLSYGGRTFVFMPLYLYIMAIFQKIFHSITILKIINNLFASLIIISAYLLSYEITKSSRISIISAIISSMIPVYINETLNKISPYSLIFPASFY
jgi:hypothetical protein